MAHKSGFVNIVGNPNVGKSTIMNALIGEKLSIITSKAQTTRHRILGIINGDDFQIIYSDTPGILKPNYGLQEAMLHIAESALEDADILLYVTDTVEKSLKNETFLQKINAAQFPVIVVINKIDISQQAEVELLITQWQQYIPRAEIIAMSALRKFNVAAILNRIMELLPEAPPYFPKDQFTDKSERFFASEIIREKILNNYKKEIPYSVEIVIDEFKRSEEIIRIYSTIYVERPTQKGIIIGHQGLALKRVGIEARQDIEEFFGKKAYLELYVKVRKDWKDDQQQLKHFGYIS